jgi:hypothetical protein
MALDGRTMSESYILLRDLIRLLIDDSLLDFGHINCGDSWISK